MQRKPRKKVAAKPVAVDPPFEKTVEQAKLAALKELAYGASHEINNPLANISTRAQTLLKQEIDPEKRRMLAAIHTQAMRAHEMIADLMLFARPPELNLKSMDLVGLLETVTKEMQPRAAEQQTELNLKDSTSPVKISADAAQLAVAIRALIQNALEALGSEGRIEVEVSATAKEAKITITDNGPGIPPEIRPHIFEPFYSGREAGRGLGFGLAKTWRIVTDHRGTIQLQTNREPGSTFEIRLPRS